MEDLLQVGVITTTHGVRGEVKVFPTTDDPARFKKLKNVVLDTGKELVDLEVAGVKFFKIWLLSSSRELTISMTWKNIAKRVCMSPVKMR